MADTSCNPPATVSSRCSGHRSPTRIIRSARCTQRFECTKPCGTMANGCAPIRGRAREMDALKHAAEQAGAGRGQIVAVMADPGIGKSRLFFEFKATSQSGWMVLESYSVSYGKASAYLPVIELLRSYFGLVGVDDERTRRERVAGKIAMLDRGLEDTL